MVPGIPWYQRVMEAITRRQWTEKDTQNRVLRTSSCTGYGVYIKMKRITVL